MLFRSCFVALALFSQTVTANEPGAAESVSPETTIARNKTLDPSALARAQNKLAAAAAIADHFSLEAADSRVDPGWRIALITNLMRGSQASFDRVASSPSLAEARLTALEVAAAGSANSGASLAKSLGSASGDLIFEPLSPPCRIVDTRNAGGAFAASETRNYSFAIASPQGGGSNCAPYSSYSGNVYPAAMAINVTSVSLGLGSPTASGFLSVFPQGGSASTSFLNYYGNEIVANAGVVALNQTNGQFSVFAQNPTQVIVDYFGSFVESPASALTCTQSNSAVSVMNIVDGSRFVGSVAAPACPAGFTATALNCRTSSSGDSIAAMSGTNCFGNSAVGTDEIFATQTCCQVPGRAANP